MKRLFAIPTVRGEITAHFGQCDQFAIVETENNKIVATRFVTPPMHQPGVYPGFLADQGVHVVIAGGIGRRAQNLFNDHQIEVYFGIGSGSPEEIVEEFMTGRLHAGQNPCDH